MNVCMYMYVLLCMYVLYVCMYVYVRVRAVPLLLQVLQYTYSTEYAST